MERSAQHHHSCAIFEHSWGLAIGDGSAGRKPIIGSCYRSAQTCEPRFTDPASCPCSRLIARSPNTEFYTDQLPAKHDIWTLVTRGRQHRREAVYGKNRSSAVIAFMPTERRPLTAFLQPNKRQHSQLSSSTET